MKNQRRETGHPHSLGIGWVALRAVIAVAEGTSSEHIHMQGYRFGSGRAGSMKTDKIIAAISTCAEREELILPRYREVHSLYHAIEEALFSLLRGSGGLDDLLRTAGLMFVVVRGPRFMQSSEKEDWLAVAMFGTVGAPRRGWEHEAVGLGINHV